MSKWPPMLGLRGTNHNCSSPIQPILTTGMVLGAVPGVGVGGGGPAAASAEAVAVAARAVAVNPDCAPGSAVCVAEIAVAVMATAVAVWATFGGSVGSGCIWPAADRASARNA